MAETLRNIGSRLELFVDNWLIDRMQGEVSLRLHEPVPRADGVVKSEAWEGNHGGYSTVIGTRLDSITAVDLTG